MSGFRDRIALVTGASRGLGRAVALALADQGAHVIAIAREKSVGALEELDDAIRARGGTATLVPLDLTDHAGIDRLGGAIYERWGRLDVLIGNAGVLGVLSPLGHIDPDVWERTLDINLTANWRLIRSLDPLLRQSDAGRAVFVTSGAAAKATPYWGAYAVSKAGLETLVRIYAQECANTTPVRANLLNPGPVRTSMRAAAFPGEDPATLPTPEEVAPLFLEMASPDYAETGTVVDFRTWREARAHKT
ncbi:MAG: SDR family NAD(P)-dependent oxidoreductase [Rhodothalassiaceae bacterium]